ncbi:MAG: NADH-quinone oxidoreductase subunit NuoG [Xanthomonadales bacterium]|nr:NADH-quinone oxidoreductase subunit NuoG [Xanthomonadales bacterium]
MSETQEKAVDTVSIEIDGVAMEAPKGSMIIEAADKAGITIPRFCYHRKLSIAANCRMCLVDVEKAPKPLPACATPVMDGMRVYTQSKRALSSQQNVMEFLLINHPLDCPICDQGGECELQDVSMGFGRSLSRFTERKRVVKDENLGSLISTDMTRCIHCTRCVRFLEEIGGTSELGGIGRGDRTFISTFIGRSIDSELSGNIIDLCPVGALTNKPYRFSARAWELRARPSVASHDCVGSNQFLHLRRGRIMRVVPRDNESINENWLADRDRWGFHGLYSDDRAVRPMVKSGDQWQEVEWDAALNRAAEILRSTSPTELGFLLSPRASNEELYLAQKIARALGTDNVDHRLREQDFADQDHRSLRPQLGTPMESLGEADAILLVGGNPRHDQPLVGHKIRQAWRSGASIFAVNARDYEVHYELSESIVEPPSTWIGQLAGIAAALGVHADGDIGRLIAGATADARQQAIAEKLVDANSGTVMLGNVGVNHPQASALRALARRIADRAGMTYSELSPYANGAGAWSVGAVPHRKAAGAPAASGGLDARSMLARPLQGYLVYDIEPSLDTREGTAAAATLAGAPVVYLGSYVTDEIRAFADVILPVAPVPEAEGSFTNIDGITQVVQTGPKAPGEARAGWKVLRALADVLELEGMAYIRPDQIRAHILEALEACCDVDAQYGPVTLDKGAGDGLEVMSEVPIYAVDAVVRRSRHLQDTVLAASNSVRVHPADLEALGLAGESGLGELSVDVMADESVARGCVVIPAGVAPTAGLAGKQRFTLESGS